MVSDCLRWRVVALCALVLAACVAPAMRAAGQVSPDSFTPARLRRVIEERYRVVPLQDGVALVPRREMRDVKSIELSGNTVAINGTVVTGAELRDRLKTDSDAILALSYLEPAARKALFEGTLPKGAAEQAAQPAQPDAPAPPEVPAPAEAAPPTEEPSGRTVRTSRHSDARVHIGGPIHVAENELVDGPVVAVGGSVTVDGDVREDVVAVGGNVRLGPKARVRGDVTSVGGTIERDPGAEIDGRTNEVAFGFPHFHVGPGFWFPATGFLTVGPWVGLMASLFRMVLFGILAFLVFLLAQNPVARIEHVAAFEPWKAGLVGLLTEVFFIPVFVLTIVILVISIFGIPLAPVFALVAIVALMVALVFGFTGVAYGVGRWAEHRFGWSSQHPFLLLLVGLFGIWALTIVGRFVSLGGWPIRFVSLTLLLVGFVVEYVAWTVGLGAAVMTRFGTRPASGGGVAPVAAGPIPASPQAGGAA
jgi:hypothetical protein